MEGGFVLGSGDRLRTLEVFAATECRLLHTGEVNSGRTFIFTGPRKDCLLGVARILGYKLKRLLNRRNANLPEVPLSARINIVEGNPQNGKRKPFGYARRVIGTSISALA